MTAPGDADAAPRATPPVAQQVAIGCLTAVAGLFSGGMIAVLVAKVVGTARRCTPVEGTPACDWWVFWMVGMIVGLITLPVLTLWKLRRSYRAAARNPERGEARGTD